MIDAVNISPASTGWQTVDVSAYVPSTATGVIVEYRHHHGGINGATMHRKYGSTDNFSTTLYTSGGVHIIQFCGLDVDKKFEMYPAYYYEFLFKYYLVGYFQNEATFFTNSIDVGPTASPSSVTYYDIDVSANVPVGTKAVILSLGSDLPNTYYVSVRAKGSTDVPGTYATQERCQIVKLDSSRIFEGYRNHINSKIQMIGYFTSGNFKINKLDKSTASTGSWVDVDCSGDSDSVGMNTAIVEICPDFYDPELYDKWGLRLNGDTNKSTEYYYSNQMMSHALVDMDRLKIFEQEVQSAHTDMWIIGYLPYIYI